MLVKFNPGVSANRPLNNWALDLSVIASVRGIRKSFIMDPSLRSIKTNNWSADILKKYITSMSCPRYSHVTLVSGYPFDSCQLTITWLPIRMPTIKFKQIVCALDT